MAKYFVGIRLPRQFEEDCEFWRRKFGAPRTIAHITLIPPFVWESTEGDLLKLLGHETDSIRPFLVSGRGLGSFGKRVLFVNVELGADFKAAQQRLAHGLSHAGVPPERRPYRPHITLATRLWPEQFDRFWSEAAEFKPNYAFRCRCISLFRFGPQDGWQDRAKLRL